MMGIHQIIGRLKEAGIYFEINSHRDGYLMISASVPGERWEIEISRDGDVDFEIFCSDGEMYDGAFMEEKINKFSD